MTNWHLTDESRFVREGQRTRPVLTCRGELLAILIAWIAVVGGFAAMVAIAKWFMERSAHGSLL